MGCNNSTQPIKDNKKEESTLRIKSTPKEEDKTKILELY